VRRKVALKIIKSGMDTKEVVASFEAERQATSQARHPRTGQKVVHSSGGAHQGVGGRIRPRHQHLCLRTSQGDFGGGGCRTAR
jgi:hypothetical protein